MHSHLRSAVPCSSNIPARRHAPRRESSPRQVPAAGRHRRAGAPLRKVGLLDLAIQTTAALSQIHQQGIIHKDINPSNIVWNAHSGQLEDNQVTSSWPCACWPRTATPARRRERRSGPAHRHHRIGHHRDRRRLHRRGHRYFLGKPLRLDAVRDRLRPIQDSRGRAQRRDQLAGSQ
jgi:serine/threonine protein kinase